MPDSLIAFVLEQIRIKTNLCSYQKFEVGFTLEPRTVFDYNLIYVTRGRVTWEVEGVPHMLKTGTLLVMPPGIWHCGYSHTKRITIGSFHVEARLPGGQDVFQMLIPPMSQQVPQGSTLDKHLRGGMAEYEREEKIDPRLLMPGWCQLIVREMLLLDAKLGLLDYRPTDAIVAQMMDEMNQNLTRPFTLTDLAERAGYSPQHLNRVFKKEIGLTAMQYLTRTRMEAAAAHLMDGTLNIQRIAELVGIDDPYYFSRLFRKHFGESPANYRESLHEGRAGEAD